MVVTGASSGIGEALAREFAHAGAKVTLVARRRELLLSLAAELGPKTHVVAHDLSDVDKADAWLAGAVQKNGPIDVLINNAGRSLVTFTDEMELSDGKHLLSLNLLTPVHLCRTLLPEMLRRKSGVLVNVSSVAAMTPVLGGAWYSASKAGLAAASESLRAELRGTGVHVVTVYPGPVHSALAVYGMSRLEVTRSAGWLQWGTANVLAKRVRKAVEQRQARVIYPRMYFFARWLPALAQWLNEKFAPMPKRLVAKALEERS